MQPVSGLTGNMFPFHFIQDMAYIAPALMMTGHTDIVREWIEKFAGELENMRRYAKHLWPKAQGIYPPWELPYGRMEGYHMPSVPVAYCYEPHNTGYLCAIAAEAAQFIDDPSWTARYAVPIIRECAAFYRAFACKGNRRSVALSLGALRRTRRSGRKGSNGLSLQPIQCEILLYCGVSL